jgi:large subunit ribosomal protein L17
MLKRKLGRSSAHRKALFRSLVTELFEHGMITTTVIKAKEARSVAEKVITCAKKGDLNARRLAAEVVNNPVVLQKLLDNIVGR